MSHLTVTLSMAPSSLATHLFDAAAMARLSAVAHVHPQVVESWDDAAARAILTGTDVLIIGWGAPALPDDALEAARRLTAIVSTSGSAEHVLGPRGRARGLTLTSARLANSRPVAEIAVAMILLAGKRVLPSARFYRERRAPVDREAEFADAGNNGRLVGIVGASTTGRMTIELLRAYDLPVAVYDPYLSAEQAAELGVRRLDLDTLMRSCTVVSIHAPAAPETDRMIGAAQLAALPDGATLINTARGSLVDTTALVAELRTGRIEAMLDVTEPEPLPAGHALWDLPNALITPHIAGSMGNELLRLGACAVDEVERLAAGRPEGVAPREGPATAGERFSAPRPRPPG